MNKRLATLLSISALLVLSFFAFGFEQDERKTYPHKIVTITDSTAVNPSEVSVSINPSEPDIILASSLQYRFPDGSSGITNYGYVSTDGGESWKTVANPNPERRIQGDDAVTFNHDGTAYHSYIAFKGLRQERPKEAMNGIFVTRYSHESSEWSSPVPVIDHINTVEPFEDKPWLVTDNTESPYRGNLYLSWTQFDVYGSDSPDDSTHIYFSFSEDGGRSFEMPFIISDHGGNALDNSNTVEGAVPAVGPNGIIYVAWSGPLGIMIDRSFDGGLTFGKDIHVIDDPGGWDMEIEGINRANGMPVTSVDRSNGPNSGRIFINWIDWRYGDPDVFIIWSDDQGETWSTPKKVNNDPQGNDKEQFFTWMAVDPVDGSVNIAFYDRRGLNGTNTSLTLARSTDGGKTFTNYRIDQEPFETNADIFFGDYLGVDAYDGRVVVAYQHFIDQTELALSAAIFNFR